MATPSNVIKKLEDAKAALEEALGDLGEAKSMVRSVKGLGYNVAGNMDAYVINHISGHDGLVDKIDKYIEELEELEEEE